MNDAQKAMLALMPRAKKHGGSRIRLDGYWFQSEPEAKRYGELKNLQAGGEIRKLIVHPEYEIMRPQLDPRGVWIPRLGYTADFEYEEKEEDGSWLKVTEEVKSEVRYAWHRTKKGKLGKHIAYKGACGPDYVMRVNLFRRAHPERVFREMRMGK